MKLGLPITMKVTSNISMTFDDLDEVIACFVEPYVEKVGEVLAHRKFEIGDSEEVKQILESEKQRSGLNQAVYRIAADYKMSGWFYIGSILCELSMFPVNEYAMFSSLFGSKPECVYIAASSFNQERFSVVPDGFYYRRSVYKSIEAILQVFKKKPSAPVEQVFRTMLIYVVLKARGALVPLQLGSGFSDLWHSNNSQSLEMALLQRY